MKMILALAIFLSLAFLTPDLHAQVAKKKTHVRHSSITTSTNPNALGITPNGVPISSAGAEVSGITGSAPGDPYNLAHPYFQGDARWSDPQQLYTHGDFPWALVSKNPDAFNFNASTGHWEVSSTASMGKSK
ncbi:MAG TPA: hypothetical protein VGM92_06045 [Candidatus Kapabacteria bacterium]|jgi:hypothetical protein